MKTSYSMRVRLKKLLLYLFLVTVYTYIFIIYLVSSNSISMEADVDWLERRSLLASNCQNSPVTLKPLVQYQPETPQEVKNHYDGLYHKQLVSNIVRIKSLNLDWCLVPKVASTSLSRLFLSYLGKEEGSSPTSPYLQKEVWNLAGHLSWHNYLKVNNTRFLISRHPFARIASAYRNKLEERGRSHDGEYFFKTYSIPIIRQARGHADLNDVEPTFAEFIDYLLATDPENDDEHWQSITIRCRLCQLSYSHILKYENLAKEWPLFLASAGLNTSLTLPWDNKGVSSSLRKYFDALPREKMESLAERYSSDFQIFGYTLDDDF